MMPKLQARPLKFCHIPWLANLFIAFIQFDGRYPKEPPSIYTYIKHCKYWNIYLVNCCRISSINSVYLIYGESSRHAWPQICNLKKAVMASLISCGLFGASVFSSVCAGLSKTHGEGAEFLLRSLKCRDLAWNFELWKIKCLYIQLI